MLCCRAQNLGRMPIEGRNSRVEGAESGNPSLITLRYAGAFRGCLLVFRRCIEDVSCMRCAITHFLYACTKKCIQPSYSIPSASRGISQTATSQSIFPTAPPPSPARQYQPPSPSKSTAPTQSISTPIRCKAFKLTAHVQYFEQALPNNSKAPPLRPARSSVSRSRSRSTLQPSKGGQDAHPLLGWPHRLSLPCTIGHWKRIAAGMAARKRETGRV